MATVIPPEPITDAILTSDTAPEPAAGEVAWDGAAAYAVGDQAYLLSTHTIYSRLTAGVSADSPDVDATNWEEVGPTNRWKSYDLLQDTGTVSASPRVVVLTPGKRINSIAVLGMIADRLTVVMTVGGVEKYRYTEKLSTRNTRKWSQYFFGTFKFKPDVVRLNLPQFINPVITITLERSSGDVTCGAIVIGTSIYMGETELGPTSGAVNFTSVNTDPFGISKITKRRSVPTVDLEIWSETDLVDTLVDLRSDQNGEVAVWMGLEDSNHPYFRSLLVQGFYTQFDINDQEYESAVTKLSLKGF